MRVLRSDTQRVHAPPWMVTTYDVVAPARVRHAAGPASRLSGGLLKSVDTRALVFVRARFFPVAERQLVAEESQFDGASADLVRVRSTPLKTRCRLRGPARGEQ